MFQYHILLAVDSLR